MDLCENRELIEILGLMSLLKDELIAFQQRKLEEAMKLVMDAINGKGE